MFHAHASYTASHNSAHRRLCQNAQHTHAHRSQTAHVESTPFAAEAFDRNAATWMLWVEKCGRSLLQHEGDIVVDLSSHEGAAILHADDCPFERAEDLIRRICRDLAVVMDETTRASLETALAGWISKSL